MDQQKFQFDKLFCNLAEVNQRWFNDLVKASDKSSNDAKPDDKNSNSSYLDMYQQFFNNSKLYLEMQQSFYQEQLKLWQNFFNKEGSDIDDESASNKDKRFTDPNWEKNPFFAYLKLSYLNLSDYLVDFVAKSNMSEEVRSRLRFFMGQYLDAISPTNFAFSNPEVIKKVVETRGESLVEGMKNMVEDMQQGYISMTDESSFVVGENLAATPGKVVFKNELIELIQYESSTEEVYELPLLVVPPCINKYYILDLQPNNSLIKYLVEQGQTVFLISWRSADCEIQDYNWDQYNTEGVIKAIEVIRKISGQDKINTLGYCIGGTMLTTSYLVMKERKLDWINSMSHATVMLDHEEPGDIKYFINQDLVDLEEAKKCDGGIVSGRIISQTFSALRSNELIWNYWINNYLLGNTPKPFDILYWNSDAVDLPLPMHSSLLKYFYVQNDLVKGTLVIDGVVMDLSKIDCPVYLFAAQKDHIVPWKTAYKSTQYIKTKELRFVLGAAGHTAGVVNPVSADKRNYWINEKITESAQEWFDSAKEMSGSWWKDFNFWLVKQSGKKNTAPKRLGNKEFKPLISAPGEYVMAKARLLPMQKFLN